MIKMKLLVEGEELPEGPEMLDVLNITKYSK